MVNFDFTYDLNVSLEQRIGFEMAAAIWSSFLTDDVTVNLHIGAVDTLGHNGQAVGGAVPIFHETHYGIYQEYLKQDATSAEDAQVLNALQAGNTVDVVVGGQLVDGNTDIMLTRAQAKALGMVGPLQLDNGSTWDRDVLQDPNDLDGYILINNTYDWHYDLTRQAEAPKDTLDFLTMALHEMGHALGFVSGLDGLIETFTLHSGEQRTEGFTTLDLMRYSETSAQVENPDGSVSDLSFGGSAYFSIDGGRTSLAEFEEGDQYQASHWQRFRHALGIMDPTLGYQERTDISHLDLTAFDAIGWDINYDALSSGLNLDSLYTDAIKTVGGNVDAVIAALTQAQDWENLGHEVWFDTFKDQILAQGWGTWFQDYDSDILEQGWGTWFQKFEKEIDKKGWKKWIKDFENELLEQGWGTWFQDIEAQMLEQGWGSWFQALEDQLLQQLWGTWFQSFEDQLLNQLWGTWFQDFETQVLEQGWGTWFQNFEQTVLEQGWGTWFQSFESDMLAQNWGTWFQEFDHKVLKQDWGTWFQNFDGEVLEQGWGTWFQNFEQQVLEQGWGTWFQENETQLLEQGWGTWFQHVDNQLLEQGWGTWFQKFEQQVLEQGWGTWFQRLDQFAATLEAAENTGNTQVASGGVGGANTTVHQGGEHDDIIAGEQKQDRINAGAGDDLVDGKGGHDVIWGGAGRDILYGQTGNDWLYGGDDDDLIMGEADNDELYGEAGHDIISGGTGDDIISGGTGKDDLKGGSGRDVVSGGEGDDILDGQADNDFLIGGVGQDKIQGGHGNDIIYGDNLTESEAESLKQLQQQLQQQQLDDQEIPDDSDDGDASSESYNPIRVEAEDMNWSGDYSIYTNLLNASGDSITTNSTATATTTFSGDAGKYLVVARYRDNGDEGSLSVNFNGALLDSWRLDQNDFFFHTRTIAQAIDLNAGDQFSVTITSENHLLDDHFDYIEFIPLDNLLITELENDDRLDTGNTTTAVEINDSTLRVEAESMTLVGGYYATSRSIASGNQLIRLSSQDRQGKALTTFRGDTGLYNIIVGYHDDSSDGIAQLKTQLNGTLLDSWQLDQNLGSPFANSNNFVTRTVASSVILSTGDIFEIAGSLGNGSSDEFAYIDYVEFVKVDASTSSNENLTSATSSSTPTDPIILGATIRIEAEAMSLNGYYTEYTNVASNDRVIRTNASGTATTTFSGESGYYNILVTYYDETDGVSRLSASLEGIELDSWQLDQVLGDNIASSNNRVTRTIATQIQVNTGDVLQLSGTQDYGEFARIDHVEFVPVSAPVVATTDSDDILEGGTGNDIVFGGEGNDLIYGESQVETSSTLLQGTQTYNGHTYLLSQFGTWQEVQAEARRLGGNLVTINDSAEESWLRNTFSSTERLWTGINDASIEGQFEWVSGEAVTYTNWAPGEPNNNGGQNYGTFNYNGQWDDTEYNGAWDWNGTEWYWSDGLRGVIELNVANNDILAGGRGDDTLYGQAGDDSLYGDELSDESESALVEGLVAHWGFDEASGIVAGDSTGNHTGTLTNMPSTPWTTGQRGGALTFGGSNDRVTVNDSAALDITETLTLATWVKADSFREWTGLITKGSSNLAYALDLGGDGRFNFQANYGSFSDGSSSAFRYSNASLTAGQWHHVAVTYDGDNVQFYLDGQLDSTHEAEITFGTNNEALILGADLAGGAHFDGALDDARVYNRALTASEIEQLVTGENASVSSVGTGNDVLHGGSGNDTLDGGGGNDVLAGTNSVAAGYFEIDTLRGGAGADTFVLGDASGAYYLGNGDRDYALIQDFNPLTDTVQLHGASSHYTQQAQSGNTYVFRQGTTSDLVAIFENTTNINFSSGFRFV